MPLPTTTKAVSSSLSASSSDRIATRDLQEYNSVHVDDDEAADDDEYYSDNQNDNNGYADHQASAPRRRRTRRPPYARPAFYNTGCCVAIYLVSMTLTLLGGMLVVYYNRDYVLSRLEASTQSTTTGTSFTSSAADYGTTDASAYNAKPAAQQQSKRSYTIYYDPSVGQPKEWNPYNDPPQPPEVTTSSTSQQPTRGYMQQPSLYNNSLVFLSEGDLYYTRLLRSDDRADSIMPAMRLTTTIGNVLTPKLFQNKIAFTATYTGRRDVYLMDLDTVTSERLTYTSTTGIRAIAQLTKDAIIFAAPSQRVSLPDVRLFQRHFENASVSEIPLAQALDGVSSGQCLYFVRFKQSSHTARYVGGTAEKLWVYCNNQQLAIPLTADYNGTSKAPSIARYGKEQYLLFLSDRGAIDGSSSGDEWRATTMNLWAMPLPTEADVYNGDESSALAIPIQITHISCQFDGMALQEYSVDPVTNNVVLRIGADLHLLTSKQIERRIQDKVATVTAQKLPIQIFSDFHEQQERQIKVNTVEHLSTADVFDTAHGTTNLLATLRGQTWVLPVVDKVSDKEYQGSGQNLPPRRYRVLPGALTGGTMRVLASRNVPLLLEDSSRRLSVVLATDPLSPTAEHAFYLVETQGDIVNAFSDFDRLPEPFLGGYANGGSTREGGLGSVRPDSVSVSPCGRRMAWADTDGRILVMTLPVYLPKSTYKVLQSENELNEPMDGALATLLWSPGGRYLAVEHQARNQFSIITVVDCGNPQDNDDQTIDIILGRHVQATPSRFNSYKMLWGKSPIDFYLHEKLELVSMLTGSPPPDNVATTLYFLTDRDIETDVGSPWGSRAPSPHFVTQRSVWALPLVPDTGNDGSFKSLLGRFAGGGALELFLDDLNAFKSLIDEFEANAMAAMGNVNDETRRQARHLLTDDITRKIRSRKLRAHETVSLRRFLRRATKPATISRSLAMNETNPKLSNLTDSAIPDPLSEALDVIALSRLNISLTDRTFPKDMTIHFGDASSRLDFARTAYRVTQIPKGKYITMLSQTLDDGTLVLADVENGVQLQLFSPGSFPADNLDHTPITAFIDNFGVSSCRNYVWIVFAPHGKTKIVENTVAGWVGLIGDVSELTNNMADTSQLALSVFPVLEYRQMFNDAWRMLRDFFYDSKMHGTNWPAIHSRYSALVERCTKREELDDVLAQMASELSALHVFVYGGEYNIPIDENDEDSLIMVTPGSLGVEMVRDSHWKGYRIIQIPYQDPDFSLMDNYAVFSPLSEQTLRLTGQKGLSAGDIIVAINGESVMQVPDIHMLLRGTIGRSVRLEVLRLDSGVPATNRTGAEMATQSLITSPISPSDSANLFYNAWEWKTRQEAKQLASDAGFTIAYIHMRSMLRNDEDAFARGFFPDYDADALILDVRHNNGGNIDSWILTMLQRQAWMYWQGRTGMRRGDADWDNQFAFRGHIIVLIDEMTASDGEGVSRGMSELGLGRLIGTRTWGGGIWLSSDNVLVDGGIASAPEIGTFNDNFGWGLGIEQHGVIPDIEVDNNPRTAFDAVDSQLEAAIRELKKWLKEEPVVVPNPPKTSMDMSLHGENCPV